MSLDVIAKVEDAEKQAQFHIVQAQENAKTMIANADHSGQELLRQTRFKASEEGAQLLQEAESRAEKRSAEIMAQAQREGEALRAAAAAKLAEAADFIVGKVVS